MKLIVTCIFISIHLNQELCKEEVIKQGKITPNHLNKLVLYWYWDCIGIADLGCCIDNNGSEANSSEDKLRCSFKMYDKDSSVAVH